MKILELILVFYFFILTFLFGYYSKVLSNNYKKAFSLKQKIIIAILFILITFSFELSYGLIVKNNSNLAYTIPTSFHIILLYFIFGAFPAIFGIMFQSYPLNSFFFIKDLNYSLEYNYLKKYYIIFTQLIITLSLSVILPFIEQIHQQPPYENLKSSIFNDPNLRTIR